MLKFLLIKFFIFSCLLLSAQRYDRYQIIDVHSGLSSNYVDCIYRDSKGFVWIGTWDGLNRYDGYDIVQYKANILDSSSLMGNWIINIYEDRQANLWICTNNGLSRYNYDEDNFIRKKIFPSVAVKSIVQTKNNHLWISSIGALYEYNNEKGEIINTFFERDSGYAELSDLALDKNENLWIGTHDNSFFRLDVNTFKRKLYSLQKDNTSVTSTKISTLCFDDFGRLWLGSLNNGLAIFDTTGNSIEYKNFDKNNPNSIGSNAVSKISKDAQGNIWVSCQNGYLNRYIHEYNNFIRYEYNSYVSNTLPAKSVSFMYQDNLDNYWIGTHGYGVAHLNNIINRFKLYRVFPNIEKSLPDNKISSFLEMNDGKIVIGTDGGGIAIFDRETEDFETYNISHGLYSDAVLDLSMGNNNDVWIATWNGGISKFDYSNKKITSFRHIPNTYNSLIYDNIKTVYFKNDTLWIATHGEGLAYYDTKNDKFVSHINQSESDFNLNISTWTNDVYSDSKNRLWISTHNGLFCYANKKLKSYVNNSSTPAALSSNQISSVFEDSYGNIWSLSDAGLNIYDENSDRFKAVDKQWNLPQFVKAIVEDNNSNLWMSASGEIYSFSLKDTSLQKFTNDDGLPLNDYLFKSALKLKDGTLLFGGVNGFISFSPDSIQTQICIPRIDFIDVFVNNKKVIPNINDGFLKHVISSIDTLTYKYNQDIISFQIAGFNIPNPNILFYSYKIEGYNDSWIQLGKNRKIIMPRLDPGTYKLTVKAFTKHDVENVSFKELTLIVKPGWWQTWWFALSVFLIIIFIVFIIINIRLKNLNKRNKILESKVHSRTKDLYKSNEALKEKQLVIEMKNSQLNEALEAKNQLISVLAHDFKNPLHSLVGVLELLKKETENFKNTKAKKYIDITFNAANTLSNQMIKLLEWVQSKDANLKAIPVDINLEILLDDVLMLEIGNAIKKEINISTITNYKHNAYVDPRMINMIYRNLLSNAIKFTPRGGNIIIKIEENENSIDTSFIDNGNGMNKDLIDTILNTSNIVKSEYGTEQEKGTGLGLRLCKKFVEKHSGELIISEPEEGGTAIIVKLPLSNSVASKTNTKDTVELLEKVSYKNKNTPKVLIIDDDTEIIDILEDVFKTEYHIFKANNGNDGLKIAKQVVPDIIISDVNLPALSGIEICGFLKKNPLTNHIPILLISSHSEDAVKDNAFKSGASDFIEKPFNSFYLKSKIDSLLEYQQKYAEHTNSNADEPKDYNDETIKNAIDFINDNLQNDKLSTNLVADGIGMSRTQLWRVFKQNTGKTLSDYIKEIKLQKAASMLMTGKYRVNEVSDYVGFSDWRYFSRVFSKEFGVSPSEYANKFKK
jgi:ligand-binding sensor domain-containing protein/signal transduction histidine kinase/AraC-like DNA-binding protein/CheY-like chemotaxis protein